MERPNIVFILSDDQGSWAMHNAGTEELVTPNLDRMAQEGIRFDEFYCVSPVCSPARASILTGRIPSAHGVHDWLAGGNIDTVRYNKAALENPYGYRDEGEPIAYTAGMPTYTDALADIGYTCALSGKWHLGDSVRPQHGFDKWFTLGQGGCLYYHPDIVENGEITVRHGEYVTDVITDRACENIRELAKADRPFYLSVHYTAPHNPWGRDQHPKKWVDHYDKCTFDEIPDVPDHPDMMTGPVYGTSARRENLIGYYAAISAMDEGIGRIRTELEKNGVWDQTIMIFTSDNGMSMGHHGIWGKGNGTYPMNMYDTAVKVPFLMTWPGHIHDPGMPSREMVSAYDIFPTLCELTGAAYPEGLPGVSFAPILRGEHNGRAEIEIEDEYGPVRMIRTPEYKLVMRYPYGPNELYDMRSDPNEEHNLYGDPEHSDEAVQLRNRMETFFARYSDPEYDGLREAVTGSGQYGRAGLHADRLKTYGDAPLTEKERKAVLKKEP